MDTKLIAYLTLDGNVAEVMKFYQSIFGGELVMQTFAEANMAEGNDAIKDRIMHAQLTADGGFIIMASDTHPQYSQQVVMGNNVNLSLIGTDTETLTEYFNKLAEGGKIEMPLEKQFWGDVFGSCEDKFGFHWMVNISSAENSV